LTTNTSAIAPPKITAMIEAADDCFGTGRGSGWRAAANDRSSCCSTNRPIRWFELLAENVRLAPTRSARRFQNWQLIWRFPEAELKQSLVVEVLHDCGPKSTMSTPSGQDLTQFFESSCTASLRE
jgi:hypothetical protein